MGVPKATVHEDGCAVTRKYDVRSSRQIGTKQAVPKATSVERLSEEDFGAGVLGSNTGHDP